MTDGERIPRLLKAVTHPDEFEPFRQLDGAAEFEERWAANAPWALANLAHAAYHPRQTIERLLEMCGARAVHVYQELHALGFLAVWPDKAVLSFRGTKLERQVPLPPGILSSIKTFLESTFRVDLPDEYRVFLANDLLADLMFAKKRQGDANVHQGFLGELDKLWEHVVTDLDAETTSPAVPVFVTGHSLGGAMATLAGLRRRFTEVVTFGEPRVGSNIASEFQAERHTRYVNGDDPVAMVPPEWWPFSYEHHGEAVLLRDAVGPNLLYDHAVVYYAQNLEREDG